MSEISFSNVVIVAAVQIGTLLGVISAATGAALIGTGLLSVVLFPLVALMLLGDREQSETDMNDDARGLHSLPTVSPSPLLDAQSLAGTRTGIEVTRIGAGCATDAQLAGSARSPGQ